MLTDIQWVKVPSVEALSCHRSYTRRREGRPTRRKLGSKSPRWLGEFLVRSVQGGEQLDRP